MINDDFDSIQCEEIYDGEENQTIAQIFADIDEDDDRQQKFNEIAYTVKNMIGDDKWDFFVDYIKTTVINERYDYERDDW
jgi:hypothetical protein